MTCHDAREWLSDLVDEALEPARRAEVDAHLLTCPECRLELERLRATVALLHRVEPARAPVGFVDRVTQRTSPTPWYRRVAAWLFLPLSIKLPAGAAAVVVIAGLAILLLDRTPELRDAARVQTPALAPSNLSNPPPPSPRERRPEDSASSKAASAPDAPDAKRPRAVPRERDAAPVRTPPPAEAPAARQAPATPSAPPSGSAAPPAPSPAPTPVESSAEKSDRSEVRRTLAPQSLSRPAAVAARPPDVTGRLKVTDRVAALAALHDVVSKLGGSEVGRRADGFDTVVEVLLPEARYAEFIRSLEAVGSWSAAGRPDVLPVDPRRVRVIVAE